MSKNNLPSEVQAWDNVFQGFGGENEKTGTKKVIPPGFDIPEINLFLKSTIIFLIYIIF